MKVVIADDDRGFVRLLTAQLKARGVEVTVAQDGMQATMAVKRTSPDLVILDIAMPAGTGEDVLKRLRRFSDTGFMPVIVVSGSTDPELPRRIVEQGADAFLPKPLDFGDLLRAMDEVGLKLPGGSGG